MHAKILTLFVSLVVYSQSTTLSSLHDLFQRPIGQLLSHLPQKALSIFSRSELPLFFEDIQHPWIEDEHNIAYLKRQRNAALAICQRSDSPRAIPSGLDIPSDIFDRLDLDNNRPGIHRDGWGNLRNRLKEMRSCPAALQRVKYLHIDVYIHEGESEHPGDEIGELLADVLSSMPNLHKIHWNLPPFSSSVFEEIFARRQLQLSSISHLVLDFKAHFMVHICPNIRSLEQARSYRIERDAIRLLLDVISIAHDLKALSLHHNEYDGYGWTPGLVRKIASAVPSLTNLSMKGDSTDMWYYQNHGFPIENYFEYKALGNQSILSPRTNLPDMVMKNENELEDGSTRERFLPFLSLLYALKKLHHLTALSLPITHELGLGFDGGPFYDDAYYGRTGYLRGREIEKQHIEAAEKAALMTLAILPDLQNICIGRTCPVDLQRDEQGRIIEMKWAWTDRLDEYLQEVWPITPW